MTLALVLALAGAGGAGHPARAAADDAGASFGAGADEARAALGASADQGLSAGVEHGSNGGAGRWVAIGPAGGQPTRLVFAPASAQTAYAAVAPGGVFATADGAAHWSAAGEGLDGQEVLALCVDPRNPLVAYAGTRAAGVWKTTSGGARWTPARRGLGLREVRSLALDAASPERVYAGTAGGLYVSPDGGRRWQALGGPAAGGAIDSLHAGADALFAAAGDTIWRSLDHGQTWTAKGRGLGRELFQRPVSLVANPGFGALYAVSESGAWKTTDRGESWVPLLPGGANALTVNAAGDLYVAVGELLARSHDGGVSFRVLPGAALGRIATLASPPGSEAVLAGTEDRGLLRSDDGGESWQDASAGLYASRVTSLAVALSTPVRLYASLRASAPEIQRSLDGGRSWSLLALPLPPDAAGEGGGPVSLVGVPPGSPERIYAGIKSGVASSRDGGASWSPVRLDDRDGCVEPRALAIAPSQPLTLYLAAAGADIHCFQGCAGARSLDGGNSWTCLHPLDTAQAMAIDPGDPATVYAAAADAPGARVQKSTDFGATWAAADSGIEEAALVALAIHPDSPQTLLALGADGTIYRSADGAASWRPVGTLGAPARAGAALLADPRAATVYYAALPGAGVFRSADTGATWAPLGDALPAAQVSGPLALDPRQPGALYAATDGRGIWKLLLPAP